MGRKTRRMAAAEERVGAELRTWISARSAEGWSLRRMAPELGVTPQALSLWVQDWQGQLCSRIVFPPEIHETEMA